MHATPASMLMIARDLREADRRSAREARVVTGRAAQRQTASGPGKIRISLRRLLVVAGAILAVALAVPSVSAGTQKAFHLDKTCAADASEPLGYVCTIQHSDFKWFPSGTKVHYTSQAGNVVQATIRIRNGSTSGACVWSTAVNAICTFSNGTGRLSEFHLRVVVTANADASIWYWDGWYSFGDDGRHGRD